MKILPEKKLIPKEYRKKLKFLKKREFWTKVVVIVSAIALLATSILPYL